eukprot:768234-Hanusia_phi.AAC.1
MSELVTVWPGLGPARTVATVLLASRLLANSGKMNGPESSAQPVTGTPRLASTTQLNALATKGIIDLHLLPLPLNHSLTVLYTTEDRIRRSLLGSLVSLT